MNFLTTIDKFHIDPNVINNGFVWKWSSGRGYISYPIEIQRQIETQYNKSRGQGTVDIQLDTPNGNQQYRIYFREQIQVCVSTDRKRKIFREYDIEFWVPEIRKQLLNIRLKVNVLRYVLDWSFKPITRVIDGEEITMPKAQFFNCKQFNKYIDLSI